MIKPTVFYHVAAMHDWQVVVGEQLWALDRLWNKYLLKFIYIGFNGDDEGFNWLKDLTDHYNFGAAVIVERITEPLWKGEVPTLALMQAYAKENPDACFLYLHTKGVGKTGNFTDKFERVFRWKLQKTLFENFEENLGHLENHAVVGWDWIDDKKLPPYFPGNFWLARADFINSLPDINQFQATFKGNVRNVKLVKHPRYAAIFWLGQALSHGSKAVKSLEIRNRPYSAQINKLTASANGLFPEYAI